MSSQWEHEGRARRSVAGAVFAVPPSITGHRGHGVRCVAVGSASVGPVADPGKEPALPAASFSAQDRGAAPRRPGYPCATRRRRVTLSWRRANSVNKISRCMLSPNQRLVPTQLHYRARAAQAHR